MMERPWLDQQKSLEERARLLLEAMSLEDKLALMHGGATSPQLGIPRIKLSDGPGGVTSGEGVTVPGTQLPAPISLGATFDTDAAYRYGAVLGSESVNRDITILLAPTVNVARSALNGRTFEGYGEDPVLSAKLGVQFIKGVQEQGVIGNVKHYAANNQERDRFTQNSIIDERTLRELYLPAFEAAVVEGKVGTVMASYNKINGVAGTEHRELLTNILKNNWGFEGYVISDFMATQSTVEALLGGLDYELTLPFNQFFGEPLKKAIENELISMEKVDEVVGRIVSTLLRFGHFDKINCEVKAPLFHPNEARQLALDSIVLLKNEEEILPLNKSKRIAVIGQAGSSRMIASGGGSAHVASDSVVSPLAGIQRLVGEELVQYAPGTAPIPTGPRFMYASPNEDLVVQPDAFEGGLLAEYFDTTDISGDPISSEIIDHLNIVWTFDSPMPLSARWTGRLRPKSTNIHTFYLPVSGGCRLFVNGQLVIDNWLGQAFYGVGEIMLEENELVDIEIQFTSIGAPSALPCIALHWYPASSDAEIDKAVQLAQDSDVAIVFLNDYMTENYDKPSLSLPGAQDRMVEAVAASNDNTVVVLNTGGPVLMPWLDQVRAVVQLWYPGQEGGNALASILFGDDEPSGRLPITFPASENEVPTASKGQFPGIAMNSVYSEGLLVGYRWYDANKKKPLFPFGHGLSYTAFSLEQLQVEQDESSIKVKFHVRNTGDREGDCIPQLYLGFPADSGEPPKLLKAFKKVRVEKRETVEILFELDRRAFSMWCTTTNRWVISDKEYVIMIGHSSDNIVLTEQIQPQFTLS